jgi:hypothetical protein
MSWQKSQSEFTAWTAGAFEAGGHISPARASLQTKDKEIADDLVRFFGGTVATRQSASIEVPTFNQTSKTAYTWSLSEPERLQAFLQGLIPFMHAKRADNARDTLMELYTKEKRRDR